MCRILFSINSPNIHIIVNEFLKQSHNQKITPGIDNDIDHEYNKDGFGITWLKNKKWQVYKKPHSHLENPYQETIQLYNELNNEIDKTSNIVIGHIKNKTYYTKHIDNTHPFFIDNQVFLHNGKIENFSKNIKIIMEYIDEEFIHKIKGNTDTEVLFVLFLTIKKQILQKSENTNMTDSKTIEKTVKEMFKLLYNLNIRIRANIIYGNAQTILITRYSTMNTGSHSLYMIDTPQKNNKLNNKQFILSSEPILGINTKIVPENSIFLIEL